MTVQVAGQASLETLVSNSPFGNVTATASASGAGRTLEFRGVLVDTGETFINLYETSTARSMWVGLNQSGPVAVVKAYHESNDTITVEYQGRELILPLKQARVGLLPPIPATGQSSPSIPAFPTAQIGGKTGPVPALSTAPSTLPMMTDSEPTEASADLDRIGEEIRQKRTARMPFDGPKPELLPAKASASTAPQYKPR